MADFKPRGAPNSQPQDPYAGWDLIHRNTMTPAGVYQKGDETAYGWAWPSMVTEPAQAIARLLNTPSGTMPDPQDPQNQKDALTGLMALYGGNALKGMAGARGAARVAATLGDMEAPRAVSYGNMIDDALSNPNMLRMMDDINYADLNRRALDDYGVGYEGLSSSQEAKLRGWSDPALWSDTGKPNPVGAAVAGHLPMDEASRMARARELGFDTSRIWYHGTATDEPIDAFRSGMRGDSPHIEHETPAIFFSDNPDLASQYARSTAEERRSRMANELADSGKYDDMQGLYSRGDEATIYTQAQDFNDRALSMLPQDAQKALRHNIKSFQYNKIDRNAIFDELGSDKAKEFFDLLDMARNVGSELADNAAIYPTHLPNGMREVDAGVFGGNFNAIIYDQLLRDAKAAGQPGLIVRNVIDSPYGASDPSTVAAVFDPSNIRSVNAAFDPAKADSSFLLASDTGKPNPLGAALASQDPDNTNALAELLKRYGVY